MIACFNCAHCAGTHDEHGCLLSNCECAHFDPMEITEIELTLMLQQFSILQDELAKVRQA